MRRSRALVGLAVLVGLLTLFGLAMMIVGVEDVLKHHDQEPARALALIAAEIGALIAIAGLGIAMIVSTLRELLQKP
jgi:hypothetical protein